MNYSIDTLLKMKKLNQKYIFFFKDLIKGSENSEKDIFNEWNNIFKEYDIFEEKNLDFTDIKHLEKKYATLLLMEDHLNKKIINCCKHEFVEDYIDISVDNSMKIVYCKICENNFDDCKKQI